MGVKNAGHRAQPKSLGSLFVRSFVGLSHVVDHVLDDSDNNTEMLKLHTKIANHESRKLYNTLHVFMAAITVGYIVYNVFAQISFFPVYSTLGTDTYPYPLRTMWIVDFASLGGILGGYVIIGWWVGRRSSNVAADDKAHSIARGMTMIFSDFIAVIGEHASLTGSMLTLGTVTYMGYYQLTVDDTLTTYVNTLVFAARVPFFFTTFRSLVVFAARLFVTESEQMLKSLSNVMAHQTIGLHSVISPKTERSGDIHGLTQGDINHLCQTEVHSAHRKTLSKSSSSGSGK